MLRSAVLVVFCLFSSTVSIFSLAQAPSAVKARASQHPSRPSDAGYTNKPFDTTANSLPSHFRGNDLQAIWIALSKKSASFKKSEYETDHAFQERLHEVFKDKIDIHLQMGDLLSFVLPVESHSYNAETQQLSIFIPYDKNQYLNAGLTTWKWRSTYVPDKPHLASNAFGAIVRVESGTTTTYDVVADLPSFVDKESFGLLDSKVYHDPNLRELNIGIKPEKAKNSRTNLKALLIGSITMPIADEIPYYHAATIDSPEDAVTLFRNLYVHLTQVWVFDGSTGEVLKRYIQ